MFDSLQQKLENAFKQIRGRSTIREKDIEMTMKEVRMALLEADVNFKVAKEFCSRVGEQAVGEKVLRSLSPDQQILKIVHDELVRVLGTDPTDLELNVAPPAVILLVGLQGSGKTTTAAKLANLLRKERKKSPLLVPADVYRPAAIDQLKKLGEQLNIPVFPSDTGQDPVDIAKNAVAHGRNHGMNVAILDTAGRLQIDSELMDELREIKDAVNPQEILLVADAMTGQEAVHIASGFDEALGITGIILSKLDGDARGGAALSMREVTGKPIKFSGMGEKLDALEVFYPDRLASRILGMGDVMTLIEKAVQQVTVEDSLELQRKMKKNLFTLDDFLNQLRMVRKMGSITSLASMIPGMGKMIKDVDPEHAEKQLKHIEAIILSMTREERENQAIVNGSRRRRIAKGSGRSVEEVNQLLKQFVEMKKVMQKLSKGGIGSLLGMLGGKMPGGLGGMPR